jgi:hypothetical protein
MRSFEHAYILDCKKHQAQNWKFSLVFFLSVEESKPFAFFFELQVQETGVLGGCGS